METNEILSKILDKLDIITKNTNTEINSGTYQYSTKDYAINLASGESRTLYTPFRSFIVLSNPDYQNVDFYIGYATEGTIQQAGQGVEMPEAVPFLKIVNRGVNATSVLINLGFGKLLDNRTNISNIVDVNVNNTADVNILSSVPTNTLLYEFDDSNSGGITFSTTTYTVTPVSSTIKIVIQNIGNANISLGTNSLIIEPKGLLEMNTNKPFLIKGTVGQAFKIAQFKKG